MSATLDEEYVVRVIRTKTPTASFVLNVPLLRWIDQQAEAKRVSKSEVVRLALERAMREELEAA
jgi:Arc/MetJ-type ribon-helix-helix transcriptional regulator